MAIKVGQLYKTRTGAAYLLAKTTVISGSPAVALVRLNGKTQGKRMHSSKPVGEIRRITAAEFSQVAGGETLKLIKSFTVKGRG